MDRSKKEILEGMDELSEILARGCLRLILKQEGDISFKALKQLDKSSLPSDQLDRKLTVTEKGRRI